MESERRAREEREARDGAVLFARGKFGEHGGDAAAVEHGGVGHGFGSLDGEAEFDDAAIASCGCAREVAEFFEAGERGGERGRGDTEMAREISGGGRARFVEVCQQRGVVRGEVVAVGFRAHVVEVAREVDLRVSALHGADEGRGHRDGG